MLKKSLILFLCALIAGLAVSWNRVDEPGPVIRETTRKATTRPSPPRPVWTTEDFLNFARARARVVGQPGYNPLGLKLADWTNEEVIAALNASLTDPEVVLTAGYANFLDGNLLAEWMRRDFDSALAWFENLESLSAKGRLAWRLGNCWPADKAEQGLAFLQANRELFPGTVDDPILEKAFKSAAHSGPAAMEKVLKILRESDITLPVDPWDFPPDFDFATLSRSKEIELLGSTKYAKVFMQQWLAQNSDQAFDWMVEYQGPESLPFLFWCWQDYKWIGNKFETLDDGQRTEFMKAMMSANTIKPAAVAGFVEGIRDPTALQEAYQMAAQSILRGNVEEHISALEQIGDPALRISLLKNARPEEMSGADETLLRQKLTDWKASPEQIRAVLTRYKP